MMTAVRAGGRLSCVSALAAQGAWTLPDPLVHVRVARGVAVRRLSGVRLHWDDEGLGDGCPIDDPLSALRTAIGCQDRRSAVVLLDSALNRGLVTSAQVDRLGDSPRGRMLLPLVDGRSDSGLETLARLSLRSRGVHVRSQVFVPGVGRVDLLIGDRLVLELDGESWHRDFERDRDRDRALAVRGYLSVRVSYSQLMNEWPRIESELLSLIRRREHRWRTLDRRAANSH